MNSFSATWEVSDGYVGKSRPHYVNFTSQMLDVDMTEQGLRNLFNEEIEADFEQTVSYSTSDEDEFVEWAQRQIEQMKQENEEAAAATEEPEECSRCGVTDELEWVPGKGLLCDDCRMGNYF